MVQWCSRMLLPVLLAWLSTVGKKMVECSSGYILEDMCNQQQFHRPVAVGLWAPYNPSVDHPASTRPHNCTCHLVVKVRSTAIVHVGHIRKPAHDDCQTHITLNTKTWSRKVCATTAQNFTKHQLDFSTNGLWVSYHNPYADSQVTFVINIKGTSSNLESWVRCAIGNKVPAVTFPTTPSIISVRTTGQHKKSTTSRTLKKKPTEGSGAGLGTGLLAGIVVAVLVILLVTGAVAGFFIWKRYQRRKNEVEKEEVDNAYSNQTYASLEEIILPGENVHPHIDLQPSGQTDTHVQYSKGGLTKTT